MIVNFCADIDFSAIERAGFEAGRLASRRTEDRVGYYLFHGFPARDIRAAALTFSALARCDTPKRRRKKTT